MWTEGRERIDYEYDYEHEHDKNMDRGRGEGAVKGGLCNIVALRVW